ncbi:MAG: DUF4270 family protein, partial [Parafilimonas sp.]
ITSLRRSKIFMNLPLSRFKIVALFLIFVTLVFSCTKIITTDIGSGLIPPVDGVNTRDTVLDIVSKNTGYDTVSVGISDDHVLGYVNDPLFGKTTASVNFQIAPTVSPFYLGFPKDNVVLDSVVLCLSFHRAWGDTLSSSPLRVHVYSMDPEELFNANSVYNNNKTFEHAQELTEFGAAKVVDISGLNDVDSTVFNKEETTNQLRIRLNNSFGQQLINYDSATVYQNDSTFYTALRGLIVEPEQTGNALLEINLLDTATHLSLYYHTLDGKDTLTRRFSPNSLTSASSNTILRDYQNTQIPSYISSANTNDDLIFMQTSPGTYANLNISSVKGMPNAVVHRAEILMYQVPDLNTNDDGFLTPPNLFVAAYSQDSMRRIAVPYDVTFNGNTVSNLTQFGVAPKSQTDPNTGRSASFYSFDVSRYVQKVITRKDTLFNLVVYAPYNQYIYPIEKTIYAVPISSPSLNNVAIGRVRLGGGNNQNYKMRLHIVYSLP